MPNFQSTYVTIIFKAEIEYYFNIQNNQEKMLSVHDVYKIHISERLKLSVYSPTFSNLFREKLIQWFIHEHRNEKHITATILTLYIVFNIKFC